jgi:hypothetical protein
LGHDFEHSCPSEPKHSAETLSRSTREQNEDRTQ